MLAKAIKSVETHLDVNILKLRYTFNFNSRPLFRVGGSVLIKAFIILSIFI